MKIGIIIPARYGSTRFPGKPLARIGEKTMLQRVVEVAKEAARTFDNVDVCVTTEDDRIKGHCDMIGATCHMTSDDCTTGTDRVAEAIKKMFVEPTFVINLQGDAPFTPVSVIKAIIQEHINNPDLPVITPVHQLSWDDLDNLRKNKETTPFSGTTAIVDKDNQALWFSKNILPAIRKEEKHREDSEKSPVWQHIGLYGYGTEVLREFVQLPTGHYEQLEGLEQLRFLENGIPMRAVPVDIPVGEMQAGIDSPEDLERANERLAANG